ncbi:TPA: hypothetical protein UOA92_000838 [Stenotrophomonas maltophilia]|nr:hypothetical protein [Stenotrophomonas maltophilia]
MSAPVPVRAALLEFATRKNPFGDTALGVERFQQADAAVAGAIETLEYAREWITEVGDRKGIPNGGTLLRIDAALARLKGEAA